MKRRRSICSALSEDLYQVLSYNDFTEDDQEGLKSDDSGRAQSEKPGRVRAFFSKAKETIKSIGKRVFEFLKRHKKKLIIGFSLQILFLIFVSRSAKKKLVEMGIVGEKDSFSDIWKKINTYYYKVFSDVDPKEIASRFEEFAKHLGYSFQPQTESYLPASYRMPYGRSLALLEDKNEDTFIKILQLSFHDVLKQKLAKSASSSKDKTLRQVSTVLLQIVDKHPEIFRDAFLKAYKEHKSEFDKLYDATVA